MYDNLVLAPYTGSSKRSVTLEARQDQGVQLNTTVDGSNEANDDTVNPDNLDRYNADGSLATAPDDSDLDTMVDNSYNAMATAEDNSPDIPTPLTQMLASQNSTNGSSLNYFPSLPQPDVTYLNLVDGVNASYQLSAGSDRNLYLEGVDISSSSGLFAGVNGSYGGDFVGRWFYMYPAEMTSMNVSRFRLADTTDFPSGGMLIALVGVQSQGRSFYVAATTQGGIYYLAACNIQGQNTKVFLVSDPVAGLQTLQTAAASWTITGGVVTGCFFVGLKANTVIASV